jgi:hypothetical protein
MYENFIRLDELEVPHVLNNILICNRFATRLFKIIDQEPVYNTRYCIVTQQKPIDSHEFSQQNV